MRFLAACIFKSWALTSLQTKVSDQDILQLSIDSFEGSVLNIFMGKHFMGQSRPGFLNNLCPGTVFAMLMQTATNNIVFPSITVDDVLFVLLLGDWDGIVKLVSVEEVLIESFQEE